MTTSTDLFGPLARCRRCGRPLRAHQRATDGMGLHCRRQDPHTRRIRLQERRPDGTVVFTIWSLTSKTERYTVRVNFEDGTFHCTCPDHQFRGNRCKHVARACDYEARERMAG